MGEIFANLNINFQALIANILGFLILMWVMNKLVFKPVGQILEDRQQDIRVGYDKLEAEQRSMEQMKADYEHKLAGIEAEAREKIQTAIKEAQATRDQIISEANARAHELVARAEAEVERERAQAMLAIREQVVDLTLGATHKLIGDGLDEKRQRKLIADFIATQQAAPANGTGPEVARA